MNVIILTIESGKEADSLDVLLSIGEEKKSFRFIREFDLIGGHKIQMVKHEDKFWETFKFNQHIVFKVTELVLGKYRGEVLELPAELGKFGTKAEAIPYGIASLALTQKPVCHPSESTVNK